MTKIGVLRVPQIEINEAVEVLNPDGAFPAILVCDHASASLPDCVGNLGLDPKHLNDHIGVDIGIAPIVRALSMLLDAPAILTRNSRLLVDCNRWIDDPSSIPVQSDGIDVPGNHGLDLTAREERWHRYFWPYHRTLHLMLQQLKERRPAPVMLALHSCTRQMGGEQRNVDAGTFWHYDRRLSDALRNELSKENELLLACNYPYSGFGGTSFTLDYHSWGHDLPACGFEIVNDTIENSADQARWVARLASALPRIVVRPLGADHFS